MPEQVFSDPSFPAYSLLGTERRSFARWGLAGGAYSAFVAMFPMGQVATCSLGNRAFAEEPCCEYEPKAQPVAV